MHPNKARGYPSLTLKLIVTAAAQIYQQTHRDWPASLTRHGAQWARNEQKCAKIGVGHRNKINFFHVLSKDYNLSNISEQYFFLKLILRG